MQVSRFGATLPPVEVVTFQPPATADFMVLRARVIVRQPGHLIPRSQHERQ